MSIGPATSPHPVLACASVIEAALKDVADVDATFMRTGEKKQALLALTRLGSQLEELRLRVLAAAGDVALEEAARDAAAWLTHHARTDGAATRGSLRLAQALDRSRPGTARALREGTVNLEQAEVIVRALDALPDDLDPEVVRQAEDRLVAEAAHFGPRSLRILGRRILEVVAPDLAEDAERKALEREEADAERRTFLTTRRRGDGTTDIRARVADLVADRLLGYLEALTSPRRQPMPTTDPATDNARSPARRASTAQPPASRPAWDRRPYEQRLGHAFGAFLEGIDPHRLPLHGGDATTVIITLDLKDLLAGLGIALVGDEPITAAQARRLACTANLLPAVLGGKSEILDLGRSRRLFSPAQRKAMAIRDVTCRAEGCQIPAAWCEAHHAGVPWAQGGKTDLADGVLLCSWHHHRAHDHRYTTTRHPGGDLRFHRRH